MNQLENCQERYRLNTWMGRTRNDGPDEFEPTKFDCNYFCYEIQSALYLIVFVLWPVEIEIFFLYELVYSLTEKCFWITKYSKTCVKQPLKKNRVSRPIIT